MGLLQKAIGTMLRPAAERDARGKRLPELATMVEDAWPAIESHLTGKPDTAMNREAIAHAVGIERWAQSRLRVGLGEPFRQDTYHGYRPSLEDGVTALEAAMKQTRIDTVALVHELDANGIDPTMTVPHNDLGDMTLGAWIVYVKQHASRELPLRVRG